ncbi:MAG: EAL domain-containing protein, partial [Chromatiales bacterium]
STGTITAALILLSFFYLLLGRTELQLQSSIRQLRENEQHLAHAQHIAHIGSWELDIKQQIMRWSDEIYEIFELNPHSSQIGFSTFTDFAHPEDRPAVEQRLANGLNQHKTCEITYRIQLQDKRIKYIRVLCEFNLDEAAQATAASGTVHDITEQKKTEMLSARMGNIFEHSWNEIYAFDAHSLLFLDVSDGAQHNLGYSMEELRQLTPYDIKPEISREQFIAMIEPLRQGRQRTLNYETIHQRKDGSTYPVEARLQISTEQSPPVFMTIVQDITERKQYIEKLEHKTLYDDLTDLPNHFLLRDRLEHAMKVARRQATMLAVLVIDVKRLREINNLMGHFNGDLVLKEVAQRLALRLRESDTVARLSGDEFAVVLSNLNIEHVYLVAAKIQRIFEQPILVDDTPLEIEAAIGVALYPDHGDDPDILIQHADIAMHIAKNGAGGLNVYNPDDDPYSLQRLKLHGELREAISKKMLVLHYQPKIDLKTCNIISVEALSRWSHPQDGMISPVDFIPMIEQSGMIRPFTLWILEQAIMQCRRWTDAGIDLSIAVNLSTRNLLDPTLPDFIASMLAMYQVSADRLSLEITESAVMSRPESAVTLLNRLHDMGIKLSIDDFGTGYSSLTYLKKLPVQELKIDQSFIFNLNQSEDDAVIVRSTIDLAHNLGLSVVAEGVESRTILETLTTLRCDIGQGYFFSRPLPANELEDWLTTTSWGLPAVSPKPASSRL